MKKITFIFAMILCVVSAMAQQGNTPAEYSSFTFLRTEYRGGDNFTDVYQDASGNLYEANMVCPSCPKLPAPGVVTTAPSYTNTNTNINVDPVIEQQKLEVEKMKILLAQQDLERQIKADKVTKRQGGANVGANYLDATGHVLSGVGLVLLGDAGEKGKLGTKIIQNFFGSTLTDVEPTGPLMGSTTNTSTNTNPVVINGNPITGSTTISNTDPRWNPLLGNTNTNRRVIIN